MKIGFKMPSKRQYGITLHSIARGRVAPVFLLVACAATVLSALSAIPATAQVPYGPDSAVSVAVGSGSGTGIHTGSLTPTNLTIIPTFDGSITSDSNSGAIEAGINAMITRVEADITNPITVNITYAEENSGLGGSESFFYPNIPYSTYLNSLQHNQILSPSDNTALASLPAGPNNPVDGSPGVNVNVMLATALGIQNFTGTAGTISLNTSIMNLARTGSQNPSFYDLQSVAGHETDEILGIGGPVRSSQTRRLVRLVCLIFSVRLPWCASFTTNPSVNAYFSIDGGTTNLVNFDQNNEGRADFADWGNGIPNAEAGNIPPQMQDSFGTPGAMVNIGPNELTALDVVGYNLAPVPEPGSMAILAAAVAMVFFLRRRFA